MDSGYLPGLSPPPLVPLPPVGMSGIKGYPLPGDGYRGKIRRGGMFDDGYPGGAGYDGGGRLRAGIPRGVSVGGLRSGAKYVDGNRGGGLGGYYH